jgi:hypothetical protein
MRSSAYVDSSRRDARYDHTQLSYELLGYLCTKTNPKVECDKSVEPLGRTSLLLEADSRPLVQTLWKQA